MINDTIKKQIVEAMKAKDEVRVATLKLLASELHNAVIANKREALTAEDELVIVKREAKKRKDAIEAYKKAGADKRTEREAKELVILQEFLPEEMGEEELEKIVDEVVTQTKASTMSDMGKVMGAVMGKTKGQADGNKVSALVRKKLA